MLERDVPDGERFELRVTGLDATLVLVINLREAHGHLSTPGAGSRHHHKFARRFDKFILAVAVVAYNQRNIARVTRNRVVAVNLESQSFQLLLVGNSTRLFLPAGQHHRAHVEAITAERVNQAEHVLVVGNAEVAADLVLFDVTRINGDNDFGLVLDFFEHADFTVGRKARQHAGCVMVIEQFSAKFQVKFSAEFRDALGNFFGLRLEVRFVIKTYFKHLFLPIQN